MNRHPQGSRLTALAVLAALGLGPVILFAVGSFARQWYWPALWPRTWSIRAWEYVFSAPAAVFSALETSTTIAIGVATMAVAVALPAARALAFSEFPGKRRFFGLLLLPVVVPPLASTMGLHRMLLGWGWTDTALGVALAHLAPAAPYATLVLLARFRRFDPAWEQEARTLGATRWQTWRTVTLPLMAPAIAVAFVLAFLISWGQYLLTLLIGGGSVITLPLHLVSFQRGGDDAITSALSLIFLAPAVVLFLLMGRFLKDS